MEHAQDNVLNGRKKAVQERAVFQKEMAQVFINGKDTVAADFYYFERHSSCPVHGVFITTGRAEAAFAAERDKFKVPAFFTAIHGAAVRRVTAVYHYIYVIFDRITGMQDIFNFFVVFYKNFPDYVHRSIIHKVVEKANPTPHD